MNDLERLLEAAHEIVERVAEGAELGFHVTGAEAQDEPAVADLVYGVGHLGEQRGIAKARAGYKGAEFDAVRGRGERCENGPAFPDGDP